MENLMKALGIKQMLSMAYHFQTNRQTEQINQEIGTFLRHYVNYQQDNWTEWLAVAEFQYNETHSNKTYPIQTLNDIHGKRT